MNRTLEHILPKVQKPARYTGGEYNAIVKDRRTVDTRYALCFPDTYEIGMSNLGCRILYGLMNEVDGLWCERCYAPWGDMEDEMRREGLLLYGLESGDPISDFDIIGFSLGYEMAYSNVLNMLDLAGLPLRSADRPELTPLIVAGGPAPIIRSPWPPSLTCSWWARARRSPWSTSSSTARPGRSAGPRRSSFRRLPRSRGSMSRRFMSRCTGRTAHWRKCGSGRAPAPRRRCASVWWRIWMGPISPSRPSSPPRRSSTTG